MGKSNSTRHEKENGIYYTPEKLARFLVEPLIKEERVSIFDPAYGGGALLLAAKEQLERLNISGDYSNLYGCDKHPVNGLLGHLIKSNLIETDFFEFSTKNKFDVILTNPPYVRQQIQAKEVIESYRTTYPSLNKLHQRSDLWAYFLVKSFDHLNDGGSLGAILPWSFIQADYAKPIREMLLNKFQKIKLLALKSRYFEGVDERILILWLKNYGKKNTKIDFAYSQDVQDQIQYNNLTQDTWTTKTILPEKGDSLKLIFNELRTNYEFNQFSNYAASLIGVVTGANKYFIRNIDEAKQLGFKEQHLIPIISKTDDLLEFIKDSRSIRKRLIYLSSEEKNEFMDFINSGLEQELHDRAHSKSREPWYRVKIGNVPDAFFPYRMSRIPYLVMNESKIQSTNSIHRIYFKNLTKSEIKWIFVSMLSVYGQLSLEANAKTYGRGILKIEPGSLGNVLVYKRKNVVVNATYDKIMRRLRTGKKDEAVEIATTFINDKLGISSEFSQMAFYTWHIIEKNRRS